MKTLWQTIIALALTVLVVEASIVNTDIKRNIQLTSAVPKTDMTITFQNEGPETVENYDLVLTEEFVAGLAHLTVTNNDAKHLTWNTTEVFHSITSPSGDLIARYVYTSSFSLSTTWEVIVRSFFKSASLHHRSGYLRTKFHV